MLITSKYGVLISPCHVISQGLQALEGGPGVFSVVLCAATPTNRCMPRAATTSGAPGPSWGSPALPNIDVVVEKQPSSEAGT